MIAGTMAEYAEFAKKTPFVLAVGTHAYWSIEHQDLNATFEHGSPFLVAQEETVRQDDDCMYRIYMFFNLDDECSWQEYCSNFAESGVVFRCSVTWEQEKGPFFFVDLTNNILMDEKCEEVDYDEQEHGDYILDGLVWVNRTSYATCPVVLKEALTQDFFEIFRASQGF
jgi:hypothetical protein